MKLKEIKKGDSVYVYSDDNRQQPFEGTAVSIGSKYITVEDKYRRKWKFDKETRLCQEWGIYYVYADKAEADKRVERIEMKKFVHREISVALFSMTDEEFETIYNIIIKYRKP